MLPASQELRKGVKPPLSNGIMLYLHIVTDANFYVTVELTYNSSSYNECSVITNEDGKTVIIFMWSMVARLG